MNARPDACPWCQPGLAEVALPGPDGAYQCTACRVRWVTLWDDAGWIIDRTVLCVCGQPAVIKLYVHHRYPRTEYLPEAVDPFYVHGGGWHIETCGNPACEPDALAVCREQIIDFYVLASGWMPCGLTGAQMAGLELSVSATPGGGVRVIDDED